MAKNISGIKPYQYPKGVSGNPSGRPKKRPISDAYATLLAQPVPQDLCKKFKLKSGITFGEAIVLRTGIQAIAASQHVFVKEMREAVEGKAPQRIELATPEDQEVTIRVVYEDISSNGNGKKNGKHNGKR